MNKQKNYVIPSDNDVLCGRGKVAFEHPGNQKLRRKIADTLDSYSSCQSRSGRTFIIRETIRYIRFEQGGRFLKADKNGLWYDGGMEAAKGRVSTAYRDARVPNKVKCMKVLREKKTKPVTSEHADPRNDSLPSQPLAFKNSGIPSRRDSLSSFIKIMLGQAENGKRGSIGFCLPEKVESMREEKENPAKQHHVTPRRSSIESLPSLSFLLKNQTNASRRDSLSSFVNLMLGHTRNGRRGSIGACGLEMSESAAVDAPRHKLNIASRKNSMDLDFGGRNFFDITEQQVSGQNGPSHAEKTEGSVDLPEDFFGNMMPVVAL